MDCDTDTAKLNGYVVVSLDETVNPARLSIRNYDVYAMKTLNLNLSWSFGLARLDATASGLGLSHAQPGPQNPFHPVAGQTFVATNLPYQTRGLASYTINPLACSFVPAGVACNGAFDLSTNSPGHINAATGTVQVAGGIVTVSLPITVVQLLDESNPSMGTLTLNAIINASAPVPPGLVPFGSDWRFLDNGTDPGPAWTAAAFNDTAWPIGVAQFGYGDGDEVTTNQFGPDPNNKHITTYYRTSFQVANPAVFTNLVLRLQRDDGAVVYLNGQEIFRSAMPEGPITRDTLALTIPSAEENLYFAKYLSPALLLAGRNVLAVEVHQGSPDSSDLSFDLELQGNFSFSNQAPSVSLSSPTNPPVALGDGFTVGASASDPDGVITLVEFFRNGMKIGEDNASAYTVGVTGLCSGSYTFMARAWDNSARSVDSAPLTVNVSRSTAALIAAGSVWKYLDDGSDQGTAWRGLAFDDGAWASGPAQLGYGEGDEATTNHFGPDPNNKYITTYYRRKFAVTNLASILGLQLRLLRDDGAVVYLNGAEIHRSNMPAGAVDYLTPASGAVSGAAETNWLTVVLATNGLASGTNVLAVEIHQNTNTSSDLSFDLELLAALTAQPPQVVLTNPAADFEAPAGAPLLLQAEAQSAEGVITYVGFYSGTNLLGVALSPPYQVHIPALTAGLHDFTAQAFNECGGGRTSAPVRATVATYTMTRAGAVWKYLDNGLYPGANWAAVEFDDASWKSGPARLGYGGDGEATEVGYGPNANNKHRTTWFRRAWMVPNPALVTSLALRLQRDDGAVVYLNGTEVLRSNLPEGPISPDTLATNTVSGAEEQAWITNAISPALLRAGTNVLAAEVHQVSTNSSDLGFDLELLATTGEAPAQVTISAAGGISTLQWPSWATGFRLYRAHSLTPPVQWIETPFTTQDDGAFRTVILPLTPTNAFYRLGW